MIATQVIKDRICPREDGFCIKQDGKDQNSRVKKLNSFDTNVVQSSRELPAKVKRERLTAVELMSEEYFETIAIVGKFLHTPHGIRQLQSSICPGLNMSLLSSLIKLNPSVQTYEACSEPPTDIITLNRTAEGNHDLSTKSEHRNQYSDTGKYDPSHISICAFSLLPHDR